MIASSKATANSLREGCNTCLSDLRDVLIMDYDKMCEMQITLNGSFLYRILT